MGGNPFYKPGGPQPPVFDSLLWLALAIVGAMIIIRYVVTGI
jgi:hypothetical protein